MHLCDRLSYGEPRAREALSPKVLTSVESGSPKRTTLCIRSCHIAHRDIADSICREGLREQVVIRVSVRKPLYHRHYHATTDLERLTQREHGPTYQRPHGVIELLERFEIDTRRGTPWKGSIINDRDAEDTHWHTGFEPKDDETDSESWKPFQFRERSRFAKVARRRTYDTNT
jgi:hypothetical protein